MGWSVWPSELQGGTDPGFFLAMSQKKQQTEKLLFPELDWLPGMCAGCYYLVSSPSGKMICIKLSRESLWCACMRKANPSMQKNKTSCLLERAVGWNRIDAAGSFLSLTTQLTDFEVRTSQTFKAQESLTVIRASSQNAWAGTSPCAPG